jgi:hypothetical protein
VNFELMEFVPSEADTVVTPGLTCGTLNEVEIPPVLLEVVVRSIEDPKLRVTVELLRNPLPLTETVAPMMSLTGLSFRLTVVAWEGKAGIALTISKTRSALTRTILFGGLEMLNMSCGVTRMRVK